MRVGKNGDDLNNFTLLRTKYPDDDHNSEHATQTAFRLPPRAARVHLPDHGFTRYIGTMRPLSQKEVR